MDSRRWAPGAKEICHPAEVEPVPLHDSAVFTLPDSEKDVTQSADVHVTHCDEQFRPPPSSKRHARGAQVLLRRGTDHLPPADWQQHADLAANWATS